MLLQQLWQLQCLPEGVHHCHLPTHGRRLLLLLACPSLQVMNYFHVAEHMRGIWMANVSNYLLSFTYAKVRPRHDELVRHVSCNTTLQTLLHIKATYLECQRYVHRNACLGIRYKTPHCWYQHVSWKTLC